VLAELQQRGASFFPELARATGRLASEVEDALWELVAAGWSPPMASRICARCSIPSAAAAKAAAAPRVPGTPPDVGRCCAAPSRAPGEISPHLRAPTVAALGRGLPRSGGARDAGPPWRDLLVELRRMEARGEIRGGRFAEAFLGEQFALPEALDLLRAVRRAGESGDLPEAPPSDPVAHALARATSSLIATPSAAVLQCVIGA
jgi:ATP-dependent Lhr-like helicase